MREKVAIHVKAICKNRATDFLYSFRTIKIPDVHIPVTIIVSIRTRKKSLSIDSSVNLENEDVINMTGSTSQNTICTFLNISRVISISISSLRVNL